MNIVLGVSGGIAAYKAVELLRLLAVADHTVRVVPTAEALRFVGVATWQALSGHSVATDVFDDAQLVSHVRLGREADLVVVAPATAHTLARAAHGLADDLLTNVLLTAQCPVVYAPAMHTEMWQHPATVANVATLVRRGALIVEPTLGPLAGGDWGIGRLAEPEDIARLALRILRRGAAGTSWEKDMIGRRVVISAGGTREFLDPVRFLGNRSSGRQGYALARMASARGAQVTLVAANVALAPPSQVRVIPVVTTEEMRQAVLAAATDFAGDGSHVPADAVVMAAAPADFQPVTPRPHKIKKSAAGMPPIELRHTPDIVAELVAKRSPGQLIVGFAAETGDADGDALDHATRKAAAKGCDLLVFNEVGIGRGFEVDDNAATILGSDGSVTELPLTAKETLADAIWDVIVPRLCS
ncbi:MAG: bifunctional phosphopantothenoylcysteine decarboxylase/phosphopantothenate--cysteine ligase CoaBC [Acidimicrobiales bacterium]|nr:MAG: bifunctional phosphopantothenoylcysteine decarboxylase/phosphopantothenate--cysteine ligase CoaBC [Acidimicrobiales bacterium]